MRREAALPTVVIAALLAWTPAAAQAPAATEEAAIQKLLDTYQSAVSRKDRPAFENLLLSRDVPFAYVPASPRDEQASAWRRYADFSSSVFDGAPFTQTFRDVSIVRHGALADVRLVYVNTDAHGPHAGWKTMQLIKVSGAWKIASEFFTDLPEAGPARPAGSGAAQGGAAGAAPP